MATRFRNRTGELQRRGARYLSYWTGVVVRPERKLQQLSHEKGLGPGVFAALAYGCLYLLTEVVLVLRGLSTAVPPALPIPADRYYAWQLLFTLPVVLAAWGLLGGLAFLLAVRMFRGHGQARQYLNTLSFSFHVPFTLTLWVLETFVAAFRPGMWGNPEAAGGGVGTVIWNATLGLGLVWALALSAGAVRQISRLSWLHSLFTAAASLLVTLGFYLLFIR